MKRIEGYDRVVNGKKVHVKGHRRGKEAKNKEVKKTKAKDKGIYLEAVVCRNCGASAEWAIPKGRTRATFLKGKICTRCGCKTLIL